MIQEKTPQQGPIVIDLDGPDGNAFVLLGVCHKLYEQIARKGPNMFWRGSGLTWKEIYDEATSSDYEWLVHTLDRIFGDFITFETAQEGLVDALAKDFTERATDLAVAKHMKEMGYKDEPQTQNK